jgi:DNA-directed RNA polymerase subunit N (RpoN/RPB10)
MRELSEEQKLVVTKELLEHVATLRALRSDTPGVPGETLLCPPMRITSDRWNINSCWRPNNKRGSDKEEEEYVFCHNDLGRHNVLVDPQTLKITAIIDWEYGGFWPEWFEGRFWERPGPSAALDGEEVDAECCRAWLMAHCDAVEISHIPTLSDKVAAEQRKKLDNEKTTANEDKSTAE